MARPRKRSQPADRPPAPAAGPDPPGAGINRKRPALLLAAGAATLAWLIYLTYIAAARL